MKHESNYNTAAVVERGGRRRRYGLFGITGHTFCKEKSKTGLCGKKCEGRCEIFGNVNILTVD